MYRHANYHDTMSQIGVNSVHLLQLWNVGCLGFLKDAYAKLGDPGNNFREVPFSTWCCSQCKATSLEENNIPGKWDGSITFWIKVKLTIDSLPSITRSSLDTATSSQIHYSHPLLPSPAFADYQGPYWASRSDKSFPVHPPTTLPPAIIKAL